MGDCWNNSNCITAQIPVWNTLTDSTKAPGEMQVLDKFTEKMLENAMSGYRPRLEEISKMRVDDLVSIKGKVRTHPEEVEAWFDAEIAKAGNIDVSNILKKLRL